MKIFLAAMFAIFMAAFQSLAADSLVKDGDRVVFVGDSITGQGFGGSGFIKLFKEGMDAGRPGSNVTVVPLGGSGHTVGSWANNEKQSREKDVFLDVKEFNVRENLDKGAGVLIIMLGMNDNLAPYLSEDPKSLDDWAKRYKELISTLKERTKARVVALGTIAPDTEDPKSPKNLVMAEMNRRVADLAKELGAVLLPVNDGINAVLKKGRTFKPDFHVSGDFVHPNGPGHAAIAVAMLKGLGEDAAAEKLSAKYLEKFYNDAKGALPCLSYSIMNVYLPLDSDEASFEISYCWTPSASDKSAAKAALSAPAGWKIEPAELAGPSGTFKVSGKLDHLVNVLKLAVKDAASSKEMEIKIPAPWLIGHGFVNNEIWEHGTQKFLPEKGVLPGEEQFLKGDGFGKTPEGWKKSPFKWTRYLASIDYTGGNSPGNVCMYAVSFSGNFEGAFGARWIMSDKDMPVKITLGNQTFAGSMGLCVALNGEKIYNGLITSEPGKKVVKDVVLKKGMNCLAFKANHCTWQWQFSIDLSTDNPSDLAGLVLSTVPPPEK